MATFNQVVLVGKLVRDPDLQYAKGMPVCRMRMLVPGVKKKEENGKGNGLFIDVVVWRRMAEICSQFLKKGRGVLVAGRLEMNQWTGKDGREREQMRIQADRVQFLEDRETPGEDSDRNETEAEPEPRLA